MRWLALLAVFGASCLASIPGETPREVVGRWVLDPSRTRPPVGTEPAGTASITFRPDGTYTAADAFTGKPSEETGTWRRADAYVWIHPATATREIRLELRGDELIDRAPYQPGLLVYRRGGEPPKSDCGR